MYDSVSFVARNDAELAEGRSTCSGAPRGQKMSALVLLRYDINAAQKWVEEKVQGIAEGKLPVEVSLN